MVDSRAEAGAARYGRVIGIVGLCVGALSACLIVFATILMGADTGSSFVGPTDRLGLALLATGALFLIVGVVLAVRALKSPASRRIGVVTLVASLSGIPLAVISLLILDALVS
jgi:hypothetical protein